MKNEKLITSLNVVVTALENGTIEHNWSKTDKCNCGLVAQAIVGVSPGNLFKNFIQPLANEMRKVDPKYKDAAPTWQQMVGAYCPLTGEPIAEIFKILYAAGLTREDIGHLETLSDPNILAKTKISKSAVVGTREEIKKTTEVVKADGISRLFGGKKKVTTEETITVKKNVPYYEGKDNLIKYLKAWILILGDTPAKDALEFTLAEQKKNKYSGKTDNFLIELRNKFVAAEKYVEAAEVRDELNRRNIAVGTAKEILEQIKK
jgi:hypothetical protein